MKDKSKMKRNIRSACIMLLAVLFGGISAFAQGGRTVRGTVTDPDNAPIVGAFVIVKDAPTIGSITDTEGRFSLSIPAANQVLTVSYMGMVTQDVDITGRTEVSIVMQVDATNIEEVIVVGFGQQSKASVVGAITQTTGEVLERAAGVTNIGAALTGQLPGVITMQSTGQPGREEPKITIRAASSWNNSDPLVLVDGIERPMSAVDVSSVQTLSVLKDASATAVFGVKGANGVILITTRRGQSGRARIDVSVNTTMKSPSRLPDRLGSYDALMARNLAIESQLGLMPDSWVDINSQAFINNYLNTPAGLRDRYPDIDWQKVLFKDVAMSYNANVSVSGGSDVVKYFVSADYLNDRDQFRHFDNHRGYEPGYGFNRLNVRANLDFQITKTTQLKMNLAGSNGVAKFPNRNLNDAFQVAVVWAAAYSTPPDVFQPQYSDGAWGYYPNISNVINSAEAIVGSGSVRSTDTRINTDFTLIQNLDFITPGLSVQGLVSWDNAMQESGRGVRDSASPQRKWIDPYTGEERYENTYTGSDHFDWVESVAWTAEGGSIQDNQTLRNLYYQGQINWSRDFGRHSVGAMGVVNRQENARGSMVASYREDWVFRATYDFANKYMFEYNGAYNGSEKFAPKYRFAFFNSGAIGWAISEEKFMQPLRFLDLLKFRLSYGEIGDDNVSERWLYMSTPRYFDDSSITFRQGEGRSPYNFWREQSLGNPEVRWETVRKVNFGIDYSFLNGMFSGAVEIFRDNRRDILVRGTDRSVSAYLGIAPPWANIGKVETKGYELELKFNKQLGSGVYLWANMNYTHAKNTILHHDEQALRPAYQRQVGYSIDQTKVHINDGFINDFDQLYGSTAYETNNGNKLPGDFNIIDFNNDGVIDSRDSVPWGFSSTPQNTFSATFGVEWKGLSAFVQFYGTSNVTRSVGLGSFGNGLNNAFDHGVEWTKQTPDAEFNAYRWSPISGRHGSSQYLYDGSYVRLKNAEIAYTFNEGWVKKLGMSNFKIYVNGNNLWLWSKMPDDRESNLGGFGGGSGAYPTVRRFNLGIKFTL